MVYITGKAEKIDDLMKQEGFSDVFKSREELFQLNPHLAHYRASSHLPPHTPIVLQKDFDLQNYARELNRLPAEQRERLWLLQANGIDIPTLLATEDVMCEAQKYADRFRKFLNEPFITTPWLSTDSILTNSSVVDLFPELCGLTAGSIRRMRNVDALDALYEAISIRNALNTEIAILMRDKGKFHSRIMKLEQMVKQQTQIIEKLLPTKVANTLVKYLNDRGASVHRYRNNHHSRKLAGKGKATSLGIEFLCKTGLEKSKKLINALITLKKMPKEQPLP